MQKQPVLAATLIGDITREAAARVKYGYFFDALTREIPLQGIFDATLRGGWRLWNALQVVSPNLSLWKAHFYQNVPAFRVRSRLVGRWLRQTSPPPDAVLQVGVLFDSLWDAPPGLRGLIYTDYTAALAAERQSIERSPFTSRQRREWIALERRAYQRARHIFVRSELVQHSLVEDYAITPEKITVVGGGVNLAHLPAIRRSNQARHILFVGKDFYRKGGDVLLLAFARLREQIPDSRLTMVTNFPKSAKALPLEGVTIQPPTWNRTIIEACYAQADIFVLPSRLETWGDVLLEAMAFGLPCVSVDDEATDELIIADQTGFAVPKHRPGALAAALLRLCESPQLAHNMGLAGRQRLEQHFTWAHVVERMAPQLHEVLMPGEK
ncbi:MAG: hypothetical protein Fur0018_13330 [Anaerolineales bacterium]